MVILTANLLLERGFSDEVINVYVNEISEVVPEPITGIEDGIFDSDNFHFIESLYLNRMNIGDISFLHDLPNLIYLNLLGNVIADVGPLGNADIPNLAELNLSGNRINSVDA